MMFKSASQFCLPTIRSRSIPGLQRKQRSMPVLGCVVGGILLAGLGLVPNIAESAEIYRCVTESGCVEFSDRPCNGGEKLQLQSEDVTAETREKPSGEPVDSARDYNRALKTRLQLTKLEREKKQLEGKRRAKIVERDQNIAALQALKDETADPLKRRKLAMDIVLTTERYARSIGTLDSQVLEKQLAIGRLLTRHDIAHRRPASRVLDRASWGDYRVFIEGDETAPSLRLRGEGFAWPDGVKVTHRRGDEETESSLIVSKNGCFEAVLYPRRAGRAGGKATVIVEGGQCKLRLNDSWRLP